MQRGHDCPLIVNDPCAHHQLEGVDPELLHSLARSKEGSRTHDTTGSNLSIAHGDIDAALLEQVEDLVRSCCVAGIHLRIDHKTDVERRIRVVEHTRAPLFATTTIEILLIDLVEDIHRVEEFL